MRRLLAVSLALAACGEAPTSPPDARPSPTPSPASIGDRLIVPAETCRPGAWCWMKGRPLTVSGDRTTGQVQAFGEGGTFLQWSVDRWTSTPLPASVAVASAWSAGPQDVWASDTQGRAWHGVHGAWQEASAALPIHALVGAPDGSLWAVAGGGSGAHGGSNGAHLLHRAGDAWVEPAPPHPYCMGGAFLPLSVGDVWSAGLVCEDERVVGVEVRRFRDGAWEQVGARIERQAWYPTLEKVGERVRVRAQGAFEWDGSAWVPAELPGYPQGLPLDQRALGDGLGMTIVPTSVRCEDAFRLDASHAWCWGEGQIHAQTADGWRPTLAHDFEETAPASAWGTLPPSIWAGSDTRRAWGAGPTDVLRVRRSTGARLERFDGAQWTTVLDQEVLDVDGAGAGDAWVLTADGPLQYDGRRFEPRAIPAALTAEPATRVRALGPGVAAAVTDDAVLVFEGGAWTVRYGAGNGLPEQWTVGAVAGTGPDDLWVARYLISRPFDYAIDHYDGRTWVEVSTTLADDAELVTVGAETWALGGGGVGTLGNRQAPIPASWRPYDATLWVGPDAIWVVTDWQAMRYGR